MPELSELHPERTIRAPGALVLAFQLSRDGGTLAIVDSERVLTVWSTATGELRCEQRLDIRWTVEAMRLSDDGALLVLVLDGDDGMAVIETATGAVKRHYLESRIRDACWSRDQRELFALNGRGEFFAWRWTSDRTRALQEGGGWTHLRRSPEWDDVVLGGDSLAMLRPRRGELQILHQTRVQSACWSGADRRFAFFEPGSPGLSLGYLRDSGNLWPPRESERHAHQPPPGAHLKLVTLEGHSAPLIDCAFAGDGHHLVSIDDQGGIIVWDIAGQVPALFGQMPDGVKHASFGGSRTRLMALGRDYHSVHLYEPFADLVAGLPPGSGLRFSSGPEIGLRGKETALPLAAAGHRYLRHTSAKVVIAGEARVGKTSLAHRLVEDRYVEHESTHGVKFWSVAPESLSEAAAVPDDERREVVLWDLGGQEEYRLIHQLFLGDTTVALLLFDPARGAPALEEIEAWNKRLTKQVHGRPVRKILVGTKQDTEVPVDHRGIERLVQRCGFEAFIPTSAKHGRGFAELREAIARAIEWDSLSTVSRPRLFQRIRDELDARRGRGEVVLHFEDLLKAIAATKGPIDVALFLEAAAEVREVAESRGKEAFDFRQALLRPLDTVVRQLALQGIIAETRDAQGERTLILQVGEVERYAGSLLIAARDSLSGVPALEKSLFARRVKELPRLSSADRLAFREERWVIECVLQLLLKHGLCIEHAGLYVFPTLFQAQDGLSTEVRAPTPVFYEFSGAIDNIYSSLVAAFALAKRFGRMRLGKDRAEFETEPSAVCGLRKLDQAGGVARLDVYFGDGTSAETRELFLGLVHQHLREHGVEMVERIELRCGECGHVFDEVVLRARLAKGEDTVLCPVNEHRNRIALSRDDSAASAEHEQRIVALRGEIDQQKREVVERARGLIPAEESSPLPSRPIRILHLSDLHVSCTEDLDACLGKLLGDLTDAREGVARDGVEYLVVSGDLTNRAVPDELSKACELIFKLIEQLHLSAERCIVVPGNHDLSWDEEVYEFKLARQVPEPRDRRLHVPQGNGFLVRNEARYPDRFRNFSRHLYHPLFQREYPLDPREQGLTALFPEHGLQFLSFNSAWEIDEHFQDRSAVHDGALERCLLRASDAVEKAVSNKQLAAGAPLTRIAVWHHPVAGNGKIKADAFLERLRQADVRLCLHGHVHEGRTDLLSHEDPVRHLYAIGSGTFGAPATDRPESTPCLYNVLELDPTHRWFRVHTRARPRAGGAWGPWAVWPGERLDERRSYYEKPLSAPLLARRTP